MDPVTHFAVPAAAGLLVRGRRDDALVAGIGGLLPDLEKGLQLALVLLPGSHFMHFQHGGSHTLVGSLLLALSGSLFFASERRSRFLLLLGSMVLHVGLDLVANPWAVKPFLPFSTYAVPISELTWEGPAQIGLLLAAAVVFVWHLHTRRAQSTATVTPSSPSPRRPGRKDET